MMKKLNWNGIEFPAKVDIIDYFGTHRDGMINIANSDICGENTCRDSNGVLHKDIIGAIKFFMIDHFAYSYAQDCTIIFKDHKKVIEGIRFFSNGMSEQPIDYYSFENGD